MPTTCCVVHCGSRGDRDNVRFYRIPSELQYPHKPEWNELSKNRRKRWILAIKRKDLTETKLKYSRVCEKHFLKGKPAKLIDDKNPDWVPSLSMGYGNEHIIKKRLDIGAARHERAEKRRKVVDEDIVEAEIPMCKSADREVEVHVSDKKLENTKQTQTNMTAEDLTTMIISLESTKKLESRLEKFEIGINFLKDNDIKTKYYTGLNSFIKFEGVVKLLEPYIIVHHNTSLPVFQQILLTLMKVRLNLDFKDLAYRFGVSPTTASTYFKNVIEVMFLRFESLIIWPSREILIESMPKCFTETFGDKVSVIIDCFEIYIEKPSNLLEAAQSWSNYKHHHTVKYLIGITPAGTVNFISEAWGGRASDKHITLKSKFLDNIIRGDVILADRGFLISEHVRLLHAELQMPAFTKGKQQLHPIEVETTRSIANVRIHVERIIGCIRQKFRILSDDMPISLLSCGEDDPILDKIVVVCCALINICPPIIPSQ